MINPLVENIADYAVSTQSVSACVADLVAWIEQAQPDPPLSLAGLPESAFLRRGAG